MSHLLGEGDVLKEAFTSEPRVTCLRVHCPLPQLDGAPKGWKGHIFYKAPVLREAVCAFLLLLFIQYVCWSCH